MKQYIFNEFIVVIKLLSMILLLSFSQTTVAQNIFFTVTAPEPGSDNMSVCDTSDIFTFSVANISGGTLDSIKLYPQLPNGILYVNGSLYANVGDVIGVEGDTDDLTMPEFIIPQLEHNESCIFSVKLEANCDAIAIASAGVAINFDTNADYFSMLLSGTEIANTGDFEITKPILSLISVTPQISGAYLGGSFDRRLTISNGGNGPLDSFLYYTAYDNVGLEIDSLMLITDNGDIALNTWYSATHDTIFAMIYSTQIMQGATNQSGNDTLRFERNEILEIREHFTIMDCTTLGNARHTVAWGCFGDFCEESFSPSGIAFDIYVPDMAFANGNPDFGLSNYNACPSDALKRYYRWINTGLAPAKKMRMRLHTIWSEETRIDTASIMYQFGKNGTPQPVEIVDKITRATTGDCFETSTHVYVVDILIDEQLNVGDTLYTSWDQYSCCENDVCGNYEESQGLYVYSRKYTDACEVFEFNDGNSGVWVYRREYINGVSETPTDIVNDDVKQINYTLSGFETSYSLMQSECNDCYYEFSYVIGAGLDYANHPDSLSHFIWRSPQGVLWQPDTIIYTDHNLLPSEPGSNDTMIVRFNGPRKIGFNFIGSELVFDLKKDCDNEVPACTQRQVVDISQEFYYIGDPVGCPDCRLQMNNCELQNNIAVHCPSCDPCIGLYYEDFNTVRSNYGLIDNNNDSQTDAPGTIRDSSFIKTHRLAQGDTLLIQAVGSIHTTEGYPFPNDTMPFFEYAYLSLNWSDPDYYPTGANVNIYDFDTGLSYSCDIADLQFKDGNKVVADLSPVSLRSVGCPLPIDFVYENYDTIRVDIFNKVNKNVGSAIEETDVENSFFVSDIPYPNIDTIPDPDQSRQFACNYIRDRFTLFGNGISNGGGADRVFAGCPETFVYRYVSQWTGNAHWANFFPYEVRPFFFPGKQLHKVLDGYQATKIGFYLYYLNPLATAGYSAPYYTSDVGDPYWSYQGDTLIFDMPTFLNDQGVTELDEVFQVRPDYYYIPTCKIPEGERTYSWHGNLTGYNLDQFGRTQQDTFWSTDPSWAEFNAPSLNLQPLPQEIEAFANEVSWLVQVVNGSNQNSAANSFLYIEEPSGQVQVDSVYQVSVDVGSGSATLITKLDETNGIYQLGDIGAIETRYFKVFSNMTNCNIDSLIVNLGWDCPGYPTTIEDYECDLLQTTLRAIPQTAELQMNMLSQPDSINMCAQASYELELSSGGKGYLYDVNFRFSLPTGFRLVPGSFEMKYPIDSPSGYQVTLAQPTNDFGNWWQIAISPENEILANDGFKGVTDLTGNLNRIHVKFDVELDCPAASGGRLRFFSWAYNSCGRFNNFTFTSGQQVTVSNQPVPYDFSIVMDAGTVDPCIGDTTRVDVSMVTGFDALTGANDSISAYLPVGFNYFPNSYNPGSNALIGEPDIFFNNGQAELRWHIQPNLGELTPINFSFIVQTNTDTLTCGENNQIQVSSYIPGTAFCPSLGGNCSVRNVTGESAFNVVTVKPQHEFLSLSAAVTASGSMPYEETFDIDVTFMNQGETVPQGTFTNIDFYSDVDANGQLSPSDVLLGTYNFNEEIPSGDTITFNTIFNASGGLSCAIIATIDTTNCICEAVEFGTNSIPLDNISQDMVICSVDSVELPIVHFPSYSYQWSSIEMSPMTAFKNDTIANTLFYYQNDENTIKSFKYRLQTFRGECISSDTITIDVFPYEYDTNEQVNCKNTSTILNGPLGKSNYQWSPTTNLVDDQDPQTATMPLDSTIIYTLTYVDTNNCQGLFIETLFEDTTCIDLELEKTVNIINPNICDTIIFTLTVVNNGPGPATGVEVFDTLSNDFSFVYSNTSNGFFNSISSFWRLTDTLFVGEPATLDITVVIDTVGLSCNYAQVGMSDQNDFDSASNNNNALEDDAAYACIGVPQTICNGEDTIVFEGPTGLIDYQWDLNGSPISGETNSSYQTAMGGVYTLHAVDGQGADITFPDLSATSIEIGTIVPSDCVDNNYTLEVDVTYTALENNTLEINGQTFTTAGLTGTQTFILTGLVCDVVGGQQITIPNDLGPKNSCFALGYYIAPCGVPACLPVNVISGQPQGIGNP